MSQSDDQLRAEFKKCEKLSIEKSEAEEKQKKLTDFIGQL